MGAWLVAWLGRMGAWLVAWLGRMGAWLVAWLGRMAWPWLGLALAWSMVAR